MIRLNNKAQATLGEYLVVFFIVVSVMSAMTIYFKRTLQARIFDARNAAFRNVAQKTDGIYNGNFYLEYEPYYTNTETQIHQDLYKQQRLLGNGIYERDMNDKTTMESIGQVGAPKDAW